jgi:hypothetical protein
VKGTGARREREREGSVKGTAAQREREGRVQGTAAQIERERAGCRAPPFPRLQSCSSACYSGVYCVYSPWPHIDMYICIYIPLCV